MKAISNIVSDFISDFHLEVDEEVICFDSVIYFSSETKTVQLYSEVQIVTIKNQKLDILYLLNPEVEKLQLPDMLSVDDENLAYFKNIALIFKGISAIYGIYILSIHPGNTHCKPETLEEIHSKTFN